MLLIDCVEQHEGVDQCGDAGGARLRGPQSGAAALGRVLQLEADRRSAADDEPQGRSTRSSQIRRSSPRGRGSTTRSSPRSRRCAARRSARRASSCSPTATTSAAPRASTPRSRQLERAEDPRVHRRHRVAGLHAGRPPEDRRQDRRHVRRCDVARGADEDLRRARLPARQRVPAPLPVDRPARPEGRRQGRRQGRRAGLLRVHEPFDRDRGAVPARAARPAAPVMVPDSARRRAHARARGVHAPFALEPSLEQGAGRATRRFRHAAGGGACRGAAAGGRRAPGHGGEAEEAKRSISAGWKASRRTWTSHRSSTIRRGWCGLRSSRGCSSRSLPASLFSPFWVVLGVVPSDRPQPRGAGQGA